MFGKRGQLRGFFGVVIGVVVMIVLLIGVISLVRWGGQGNFVSSLQSTISGFTDGLVNILGPILGLILNLPTDSDTSLLMILAFILVSAVIISTLDSVNIFGDDTQGIVINSIVGIIVAIIGVRFMPRDIWAALTAPSSAFVATLLVGAPFAVLFFVTMKIKFPLANKLLWLFYIVFMSYLIFFPSTGFSLSNSFMWVYFVFLILAAVMMFFDSTVRTYFLKEKVAYNLSKGISQESMKERLKISRDIKELITLKREAVGKEDKQELERQIRSLRRQYKDLGGL